MRVHKVYFWILDIFFFLAACVSEKKVTYVICHTIIACVLEIKILENHDRHKDQSDLTSKPVIILKYLAVHKREL